MTQLPKLFSVAGGGENFFERIVVLGGQLPDTNLAVFAFGLAAVAVLLLGILQGVMVAVVVSLLLLIGRVARPHVASLGRIPGTGYYSDIERHPENEAGPGALIFRVEASLLYFNVEHVREAVWQKIRAMTEPPKLVVFDLSTSPIVDLAGARMLPTLHAALHAQAVPLRLVAAHAAVRDLLRAEGLEERVGHIGRRATAAEVIDEFQRNTDTAGSLGNNPHATKSR